MHSPWNRDLPEKKIFFAGGALSLRAGLVSGQKGLKMPFLQRSTLFIKCIEIKKIKNIGRFVM